MGLDDLVKEVDPRKKENHCPNCGMEGEETERPELRCPSPEEECDVVYWFPGTFEELEEAYSKWD